MAWGHIRAVRLPQLESLFHAACCVWTQIIRPGCASVVSVHSLFLRYIVPDFDKQVWVRVVGTTTRPVLYVIALSQAGSLYRVAS